MPEPQQKNQNYTPVNGGFAGYPNMYPGLVLYGTMSPKEVGANIKKALPFALGLGAAVGTGGVALPAVFGDMVGAAAADIPVLTIAGAGKAAMPVVAGAGTTYMTKEGFPKVIQTYKELIKKLINKKNNKAEEAQPQSFKKGGISYALTPTQESLQRIGGDNYTADLANNMWMKDWSTEYNPDLATIDQRTSQRTVAGPDQLHYGLYKGNNNVYSDLQLGEGETYSMDRKTLNGMVKSADLKNAWKPGYIHTIKGWKDYKQRRQALMDDASFGWTPEQLRQIRRRDSGFMRELLGRQDLTLDLANKLAGYAEGNRWYKWNPGQAGHANIYSQYENTAGTHLEPCPTCEGGFRRMPNQVLKTHNLGWTKGRKGYWSSKSTNFNVGNYATPTTVTEDYTEYLQGKPMEFNEITEYTNNSTTPEVSSTPATTNVTTQVRRPAAKTSYTAKKTTGASTVRRRVATKPATASSSGTTTTTGTRSNFVKDPITGEWIKIGSQSITGNKNGGTLNYFDYV